MDCRRYLRALTSAFGLPQHQTPALHDQRTFLTIHLAPNGASWASYLRGVGPPVIGEHGFVEGPWGGCITAACLFEARTPNWDAMPEYSGGPAGQVLDFCCSCGHEAFLEALERTEEATHQAIARGDPLPGHPHGPVQGGDPAARVEAAAVQANPISEQLIQALAEADAGVVHVHHEFSCPITQELMRDPVIAADGHSYDRAAIQQWLAMGRRTSPVTNAALPSQSLVPNLALRSQILEAAEAAARTSEGLQLNGRQACGAAAGTTAST
mmetsp:Transcript_92930/g.277335  ORF Transcript_92930/g.277335 Transcript_92930/m.277335 type:complete len:269 (+) Transcript_92930:67-873(+)